MRQETCCLKQLGFTLIELIIAIAIIAILSAVAYPSYVSYIQKSRRTDATTSLSNIQLAQETYNLKTGTYGNLTNLGLSSTSPEGYYTITMTNVSSVTYTATATPVSGKSQASDSDCASIVLAVTNGGNTLNQTPSICWAK